jgi:hypothetical protein
VKKIRIKRKKNTTKTCFLWKNKIQKLQFCHFFNKKNSKIYNFVMSIEKHRFVLFCFIICLISRRTRKQGILWLTWNGIFIILWSSLCSMTPRKASNGFFLYNFIIWSMFMTPRKKTKKRNMHGLDDKNAIWSLPSSHSLPFQVISLKVSSVARKKTFCFSFIVDSTIIITKLPLPQYLK